MLNGSFPVSSLQTYNQLTGSKPYTIVEYADRAIVHLNKAEAIYNENFIPTVADLLLRKSEIEINCGRKSPGAKFVAEELCSEDIKRRIYTQDHEKPEGNDSYDFTVSIKHSIGFFDSPELENIIVVIKRKNKDTETKPTVSGNTLYSLNEYNDSYIINIAGHDSNGITDIENPTLYVSYQNQSPVDPELIDFLARSLCSQKKDKDYEKTSITISQNYDNFLLSSQIISQNTPVVYKEEILLEGYGPWNDEFNKALSLIEQGKTVVLKKDDPLGIEETPVSLEIKRGQNKKEVLIDLTNSGIIKCSDVLPKLLTYLLDQDDNVIVNCGFMEANDLAGDVEEYLIPELPCSTTYEIAERELPAGCLHPVLILRGR